MKKKLLSILLMGLVAVSLTACAKTPKDKAIKEKQMEIMQEDKSISSSDALKKATAIIDAEGRYNDDGSEKSPEELFTPPEKDYDWKYYTPDDKVMQLNDIMYVPGMPLKDLMLEFENSDEEDFEYSYNEEELTTYGKTHSMTVTKNGTNWVKIQYDAITEDETITIADCLVTCFEPYEAAYNYLRLFDGTSYFDLKQMNYDQVLAYIDETFDPANWFVSEHRTTYDEIDVIEIRLRTNYESANDNIINVYEWPQWELSVESENTFIINAADKEPVTLRPHISNYVERDRID